MQIEYATKAATVAVSVVCGWLLKVVCPSYSYTLIKTGSINRSYLEDVVQNRCLQ